MKEKIRKYLPYVVMVIGLLAMNYPLAAESVNKLLAKRAVRDYMTYIQKENDELPQLLKKADAYNQALAKGTSLREVSDFELLADGAMLGYVEIPQIDVTLAVRYGTNNEVLKKCLGLIEQTSLPIGGESTHAVISGHTGMASQRMLTDLTELMEGDVFFVHCLGQDKAYQVDQIVVVEPWDVSELAIVEGRDYVTLLTCTPYGINDHRLLVRGCRTDAESIGKNAASVKRRYSTLKKIQFAILGFTMIVLIGFAYNLIKRKGGAT